MKSIRQIAILFLLIIMSTGSVLAVATGKFTVTAAPNKTQLQPNETLTLTVAIEELPVGNGINMLQGVIEYDATLFSMVNITGQNNWSVQSNSIANNTEKFVLLLLDNGIQQNTTIGTITLQVKSNITEQRTTQICLKQLTSTQEGESLITAQDVIVPITVQASNIGTSQQTTTPQTTGSGNTEVPTTPQATQTQQPTSSEVEQPSGEETAQPNVGGAEQENSTLTTEQEEQQPSTVKPASQEGTEGIEGKKTSIGASIAIGIGLGLLVAGVATAIYFFIRYQKAK